MSDFKDVFKKLRKQHNLTQEEMAKKLNISRSSIGMYEQGEREPSFEVLEAIADYFNVDIDYLIGRKETTERIPFVDYIITDNDTELVFEALNNIKGMRPDRLEEIKNVIYLYLNTEPPLQDALRIALKNLRQNHEHDQEQKHKE